MRARLTVAILTAAGLGTCGCGDEGAGTGADTGPAADGATEDAAPPEDAGPDTGVDDGGTEPHPADAGPDAGLDGGRSDAAIDGGGGPPLGTCADPAPAGSERPADPPTYSGGSCPDLSAGRNTIVSDGNAREIVVVVPEDYDGSEQLPLVFLWHWLGGEAQDFVERGEVQQAADEKRFIAVSMEAKGDLEFQWPYATADTGCGLSCDERLQEELTYFDDVLACITAQYAVDRSCVSSVGVSAGALWTAQLAPRRSEHLASFISLSGGTGGSLVRDWVGAEHAMPALVLWGGPTDFCGVQFDEASMRLEDNLQRDNHTIVECIHNCGHTVPPFDPPEGASKFSALWEFVLDHPYWLEDGASPWRAGGMPAGTPDWCAMGASSATMRTGDCPPSECM